MSLYTHVRNKDDLLDGTVDAVIGALRPAHRSRPRARRL
jgi:AcrR family transcriptional regulator